MRRLWLVLLLVLPLISHTASASPAVDGEGDNTETLRIITDTEEDIPMTVSEFLAACEDGTLPANVSVSLCPHDEH